MQARQEQAVHNYEQWHEIQMATMRTIDENSDEDDDENYDWLMLYLEFILRIRWSKT